ncbi:GNAT family N-acetyltransferase [Glycomyces salinus]|uniref:GNAT family N-acetyltransferase n=1 Tax=Glycomyces salinus TaxID=980294 RepID=UPI0018EBAD11|nr:GNAT family N-acetyltransferase [Glycomyces salinus]
MVTARFAAAADIDEIVRLRQVMLQNWVECPDNGWRESTAELLRRRLSESEPTMAVTVVEAPDAPGELAACASGTIEERLPSPGNLTGRFGWIFNVSTDQRWRRRGYGRICTEALLAWYEEWGVPTIDLLASESGRGLYKQLGFEYSAEPAMRRRSH